MNSLVIPPLGNLTAYIDAVNKFPILSVEEEYTLATDWIARQDQQSAAKLIMSHLRLVVSMARDLYVRNQQSSISFEDLIQEGNIGLMKAVQKFDPNQGSRLASYAMFYIKHALHGFIHSAAHLVKRITTKDARDYWNRAYKLIYAHRSQTKTEHRKSLSVEEANLIAENLKISIEEVYELEARFSTSEVSIDIESEDDDEWTFSIPDMTHEPSKKLEALEREYLLQKIETLLPRLDDRSRKIIQERWYDEPAKGLKELGLELGVSSERVRQIEVAAMKKLKTWLS